MDKIKYYLLKIRELIINSPILFLSVFLVTNIFNYFLRQYYPRNIYAAMYSFFFQQPVNIVYFIISILLIFSKVGGIKVRTVMIAILLIIGLYCIYSLISFIVFLVYSQ